MVEIPLELRVVVVFSSESISEAAGKGSELFEFERVTRTINDASAEESNAKQIINNLFSELVAFSDGFEQDDYQTIVVVRAA